MRAGRTANSRPSELAHGIAALACALPENTARDLYRLLSHSVAAPTPAEIREARLGLMLDLVAEGTGEFIGVERYEGARAERAADGEIWPAHATLCGVFGSWTDVVSLAMRLAHDGTSSGVPHTKRHLKDHAPPYLRDDVLDALTRCASDLGGWPGEWEYYEWARVSRMLARDAGKSTRRFPGRGPICRLFGDFGRAVNVAQRRAKAAAA